VFASSSFCPRLGDVLFSFPHVSRETREIIKENAGGRYCALLQRCVLRPFDRWLFSPSSASPSSPLSFSPPRLREAREVCQEETRKNDGKSRVIHGGKRDCLDKRERGHLARMSASFNADREASTTNTHRRLPASNIPLFNRHAEIHVRIE